MFSSVCIRSKAPFDGRRKLTTVTKMQTVEQLRSNIHENPTFRGLLLANLLLVAFKSKRAARKIHYFDDISAISDQCSSFMLELSQAGQAWVGKRGSYTRLYGHNAVYSITDEAGSPR